MKWLKKFFDLFKKKEKNKLLEEHKEISSTKKKTDFMNAIKSDSDYSFLYKNYVETPVNDGDGLGIKNEGQY